MKEIKKTDFVPKAMILASKEKLCINPDIQGSNISAIRHKCKQLGFNCTYWPRPGIMEKTVMPHDSYDIEEMHIVGDIIKTCPFYHNKVYHQDADIVLVSY